jgi:rare lipoprotein A (peptidoglycan hydrolase)
MEIPKFPSPEKVKKAIAKPFVLRSALSLTIMTTPLYLNWDSFRFESPDSNKITSTTVNFSFIEESYPMITKLKPTQPEENMVIRRLASVARPAENTLILPPSYSPKYTSPTVCILTRETQVGKGSVYSSTGCVGCSKDRTMANGEKFDDDAFTVANNRFPLENLVLIENLTNGKKVIAKVTDRGGFDTDEYNRRIIDVSPAVNHIIRVATDKSELKITKCTN